MGADPVSGPVADSKPWLKGVTDLGGGKQFLLVPSDGTPGTWKKVGDAFGDWKIAEYREYDRTLVLRRDSGARLELVLAPSPATAASPPVASNAQANAYAIGYLQARAVQLKQQAEAAEEKFAAFKARNEGLDPSQMPAGPTAAEGNSLKIQATVARSNYMTILERLSEAQHGKAGIDGAEPPK